MRISKKQKQEIDFLSKYFDAEDHAEEDIVDYINSTVYGQGSGYDFYNEKNKLKLAKRRLELSIAMWREDMQEGLLAYWELLDDFDNHPFIVRMINSIRKRNETKPSYDGGGIHAALAFINSKHYLGK